MKNGLSRSEQRTGSRTQKQPLDRKSPIQVACEPEETRGRRCRKVAHVFRAANGAGLAHRRFLHTRLSRECQRRGFMVAGPIDNVAEIAEAVDANRLACNLMHGRGSGTPSRCRTAARNKLGWRFVFRQFGQECQQVRRRGHRRGERGVDRARVACPPPGQSGDTYASLSSADRHRIHQAADLPRLFDLVQGRPGLRGHTETERGAHRSECSHCCDSSVRLAGSRTQVFRLIRELVDRALSPTHFCRRIAV
jgi:hypothetical protein